MKKLMPNLNYIDCENWLNNIPDFSINYLLMSDVILFGWTTGGRVMKKLNQSENFYVCTLARVQGVLWHSLELGRVVTTGRFVIPTIPRWSGIVEL